MVCVNESIEEKKLDNPAHLHIHNKKVVDIPFNAGSLTLFDDAKSRKIFERSFLLCLLDLLQIKKETNLIFQQIMLVPSMIYESHQTKYTMKIYR